jgi:hypothetical protein
MATTERDCSEPVSGLLTDISGIAVLLKRSERSCRNDLAAGRLPAPIQIGASKRWRVSELREWIAAGCPNRESWAARKLPAPQS